MMLQEKFKPKRLIRFHIIRISFVGFQSISHLLKGHRDSFQTLEKLVGHFQKLPFNARVLCSYFAPVLCLSVFVLYVLVFKAFGFNNPINGLALFQFLFLPFQQRLKWSSFSLILSLMLFQFL